MGSLSYGKSLIPHPLTALAGLLAVGLAAGAGWLAADKLVREPPVAPQAPGLITRAGPAELQLRAGWLPEAKVPRVPGLERVDARSFAPSGGGRGRMVIAVLPREGGDLPSETVAALRVPLGASERATVGRIRGAGYTALSLRGVPGLTDLYTVRTAAGLLAVSCIAPIEDPLPAGSCPGDVMSIAVRAPVTPEPAAKLEALLVKLTATLNRERRSGRVALRRGSQSDAQARAARSLWRAYRAAAGATAAVAPSSAAGAQLPAAFRDAARAYRALAVAASRHDERAWARARRGVNAAERAAAARLAAPTGR